MTRILVTGATGFIARTLCLMLAERGWTVRAALRSDRSLPDCIDEKVVVGDIGSTTEWDVALRGVGAVVHLAATAHVRDQPGLQTGLYFETNERGTQRLALAAARAGVHRFVFLSSVKVNGERTDGRAYRTLDAPHPHGAYGESKWRGEQRLLEVAADSRMEAVIVRAPLVYGPWVRANFLHLLQWVEREWPLPLGAVHNTRSLVSVWNLCDLLLLVLTHPAAAGRTWMVCDGEDLSTPELIRRLAQALNRRTRLLSVAPALLQACGALIGQRAAVVRLCGSLAVDSTETRRELSWSPPITVDEGLARTCSWYLSEYRRGT